MNTYNDLQTDNHKMKTIIRNAQVYDGSGNPPQDSSDVAIENGVISHVGKGLDPAKAEEVLDRDHYGLELIKQRIV